MRSLQATNDDLRGTSLDYDLSIISIYHIIKLHLVKRFQIVYTLKSPKMNVKTVPDPFSNPGPCFLVLDTSFLRILYLSS